MPLPSHDQIMEDMSQKIVNLKQQLSNIRDQHNALSNTPLPDISHLTPQETEERLRMARQELAQIQANFQQ